MGDSKLNSDIVVHNILIDGAGKCGKVDIARVLLQGLIDKGLQLNVRTYNVRSVVFVGKNKHYDDVKMLLKEMDDGRGYSLDASTLSLFIDQIAAGSLDRSMLKLLAIIFVLRANIASEFSSSWAKL
ncbi:putative pentatricopeptide repeat-containing protein At1g12700, mitochondrial [Helianthus annuus]|uniref:putative pentatricopeptide repeat-containing protein At1g12700, mitochondrial n=1 Tax=Helianthus annuus TaxID=4232 RepID=UPI000B8FAA23|nr:putative pentatricopeptide repeat-containing protein At1g12700, mitochondrial [Helianthus annuus]